MERSLTALDDSVARSPATSWRRWRFGMTSAVFLRLVIGFVLVWSGVSKIHRPYDFLSDVYHYEIVGAKLGLLVAIVLPWFELLVGGCLLTGALVEGALVAALGLSAVYVFVNLYAIHNNLSISCGCFGGEDAPVGYSTLARAFFIFGASAACLLRTVLSAPPRSSAAVG